MEQSPLPPQNNKKLATPWIGLAVFITAVVAVLIYVSSEKHDTTTLIVLAAVLLVGQIVTAVQWFYSAKKTAAESVDPLIIRKMDERMVKSFANQEIIHNEVHSNYEALAKRLDAVDTAQKYLANRLDESDKTPRQMELHSDAVESIAVAAAAKVLAGTPKIEFPPLPEIPDNSGDIDDAVTQLTTEIRKINETLDERIEKFNEEFEEKLEGLAATINENKQEHTGIEELNERLDTLALNQENILEKLEALEILPEDLEDEDEDEEKNENSQDLSEEPEDAEDEEKEFPLPDNMLERAQVANAATGSAVEKMISDNAPVATEEPAKDYEDSVAEKEQEEPIPEPEPETATEPEPAPELAPAPEPEPASEPQPEPEEPQAAEAPVSPEPEPPQPAVTSSEPAAEPTPPPQDELQLEDLPHTALILRAEFGPGEKPFLRGDAPGLSPKKSTPMEYSGNARWRFDFGPMKEDAEITLFRNDTNEALGDPFMLPAGKVTTLSFSPDA